MKSLVSHKLKCATPNVFLRYSSARHSSRRLVIDQPWRNTRLLSTTRPRYEASITPIKDALDSSPSPMREPEGALQGVKILDLSRVLAAPYCTQILADYGAEVIKLESDKGDDTRHFKASGENDAWEKGIGPMSNYFAAVNRNKRSMSLDLKQAKGKAIFMQLVKWADVV